MTDSKDTINDMEFVVALKNFIEVQNTYINQIGLPGRRVEFVLKNVFSPLARRIKAGERSKKLYKELMALEA
jgi:predicted ester cyclase